MARKVAGFLGEAMKRTGARDKLEELLPIVPRDYRSEFLTVFEQVEAEARDREALRIAFRLAHEGVKLACFIGEDIRAEVQKRRSKRNSK